MGFGIGVSSSGMGPRNAMETFAEGDDGSAVRSTTSVWCTRMLVYLRPYTKMMTLAFVAMLADSALTLLAPYLLKITVDTYISQGDQAGLVRISLWTAATFHRVVYRHSDGTIFALAGGAAHACQYPPRPVPPSPGIVAELPRYTYRRRDRFARDERCGDDQ